MYTSKDNLIRAKSKFDKYGKLSSNLLKTKLLDFYAYLKISWMSFLVIPWRKPRRLAEFTNTYEVADNFVDRKSDFFNLAGNEKIVITYVFTSEIRNEHATMTLR